MRITTRVTTLASALLAVGAGAAAAGSIAQGASRTGPVGITRYLALPAELPGLTFDHAHIKTSAKAWLADEPADEAKPELARYRREGFRRAAYENFTGPQNLEGVSNVIVFATRAGALDDQTTVLHPVGKARHFTVKGIPGARGFTQGDNRHGNAADVVWVQGRCTMVIGEYVPRGVVRRAPLVSAAKAVHRRTHGTCP